MIKFESEIWAEAHVCLYGVELLNAEPILCQPVFAFLLSELQILQ